MFLLGDEIESEMNKFLYDAYVTQAARKFEYGVRNHLNKLERWPEENGIQCERIKECKGFNASKKERLRLQRVRQEWLGGTAEEHFQLV